MGIYIIKCPECKESHQWFSGNTDQRCKNCREKVTMTKPILEIAKELMELESESELCVVCLAPCEYHRDSEGTQSARSIVTSSQLRTLCEALVEADGVIRGYDNLIKQKFPEVTEGNRALHWLKKWGGECQE